MWPTEQHQVLLVTVKDNSKREKKVPCKSPIFHNKYVADLNEKSEISNSFIANQCCLIPNNSILPSELKGSRAVLWRTFPEGQFPERTFFERTVPRSDISQFFLIIWIFIYSWYIKLAEAIEFQQKWIAGILNCLNLLEIASWKFPVNFKASLRNLVGSSFLEALQPVDSKTSTPVKMWLLQISIRDTFWSRLMQEL